MKKIAIKDILETMEEMNTDWVIDAIRELLILLGVKLWISRRMSLFFRDT